MRRIPMWRRYLRFWGPDIEADVDEELAFHLAMRSRDFEASGMSPDEARRAAAERFGDVAQIGTQLRDHDRQRQQVHRRREVMGDLAQDLTYGFRALRRSPGFSVVAILTIALGIGATTAIFSVINGVVLRPLPYAEPDRIVMVWMDNTHQGVEKDIHSYPNFEDYRTQNTVLSEMAGFSTTSLTITGGEEPQRIRGAAVMADLFRVLRVTPAIGRVFTTEEEAPGNDGVVVLSHGFWVRAFGGDRRVVGTTVQLNGSPRTIIGVMPPDFAFPAKDTEAWVPLDVDPQLREARNSFWLSAVGRLRPEVTLERAEADLATIASRIAEEYPGQQGYGANLVPLPDEVVGGTVRTALWVMMGAVVAVLLIACANVANLLLSRAAAREREIGVRVALGASRRRVVRQLLTESVLLGIIGGVAGVVVAWAGLRLLMRLAPADLPRIEQVSLDPVMFGLALLLSVVTGLAFGLVPALQSSRTAVSAALREGGRGGTAGRQGQRLRRVLVGAQLAMVVVLLTAAGLMIRSFIELQRVDLGFRAENLLTMRLQPAPARYDSAATLQVFYGDLLERTRAIPGVQDAAAITDIFLSETPRSTVFVVEGQPLAPDDKRMETPLDAVTPNYFQVMGIPLLRGRVFTEQDRSGSPDVAIINEGFASRYWPAEDAVGKRFKFGDDADSDAPWMTVVGVVGDMRRTGFDRPVRYETYLPYAQFTARTMTLVVRTVGDAATMAGPVRQAVRTIDPDQPVFDVRTMDETLSGMMAQRRFSMALIAMFATLALLLALVGVYGVTAYLVAQRTREIGVRLALGAEPGSVVGMVVRQGMGVAAVALALGVAAALALTRLMAGLLYGVSSTDLLTFAAVVALLATVTAVANWLPARRAARVDLSLALRGE
jgi:putative ABC transport system permease protein